LSFVIERGAPLVGALYLGGSILLLVSIVTVEEFIRQWRGRKSHVQLLVPPILGFASFALVLPYSAIFVLALFIAALAFVSVRVIQRREREWQTRIGFTGAVFFMATLGPLASGAGLDPPLILFILIVPFTFFSAQELLVQHIAELWKLSSVNTGPPGFRDTVQLRQAVLVVFLFAYAIAAAATAFFVPKIASPITFELFLVALSVIWATSKGKPNFNRLGIEQASLDILMVVAVVFTVMLG
jgi:hypothetical protein